jgi:hypothetical protein
MTIELDPYPLMRFNVLKTIINHPQNHHFYGTNHQTCGGLLMFFIVLPTFD